MALLPDASSGMSQGRNEAQLVFLRFLAIHNGRCVGDLRSEDVEVLENGRRQQVALFQGPSTPGHRRPVHLVVLPDVGGTVKPYRALTAKLLESTAIAGLGPAAQISVYSFGTEIHHPAGPTRDTRLLQTGISGANEAARRTYAKINDQGSRVFDAVQWVCQKLRRQTECSNTLLVFSDGLDTSTATAEQTSRRARQTDTVIYPVVVREVTAPFEPWTYYFARLGNDTGGRHFDPFPLDSRHLRRIVADVVSEQTMEYVVGYYPEKQSGPITRNIRVNVPGRDKTEIRGGRKELVF